MSSVFAVCDVETDYAIRFMEFLNRRNLPFEVNCSGLTRTVRLVKKSETSDLHICSRCQQHAGKE